MNRFPFFKQHKTNNGNKQHQYPGFFNNRFAAPTSVHNFAPLDEVGSGAFATVYKGMELMATIPPTYREVALKRINLQAIKEPDVLKTTMNEVNLFKELDHENIVKCFYSFDEHSLSSGTHYLVLVLEYIDGGDLQQWLQRTTFPYCTLVPECDIWYLFAQIADAVAHIHSKQIMHRDLKPANVLLTRDYHVKLADFGLNRLQKEKESKAKTVCGTPYYMSPERIVEMPYSFKSDIWSLGCVLYEMAALVSPFFGEKENVDSLIQKIIHADFPPLPEDCYSPQLETLMFACMNPCMEKRPSAKEVHRVAKAMADRWVVHYREMRHLRTDANGDIVVELGADIPTTSTTAATNMMPNPSYSL